MSYFLSFASWFPCCCTWQAVCKVYVRLDRQELTLAIQRTQRDFRKDKRHGGRKEKSFMVWSDIKVMLGPLGHVKKTLFSRRNQTSNTVLHDPIFFFKYRLTCFVHFGCPWKDSKFNLAWKWTDVTTFCNFQLKISYFLSSLKNLLTYLTLTLCKMNASQTDFPRKLQ